MTPHGTLHPSLVYHVTAFASPVIKSGPVLHVGTPAAAGLSIDAVREMTRTESDECHANVGSVIDTLRRDYPTMLNEAPDLSMFKSNVQLTHAESGRRLEGLDQYARIFSMLRFIRASPALRTATVEPSA